MWYEKKDIASIAIVQDLRVCLQTCKVNRTPTCRGMKHPTKVSIPHSNI